MTKLKVKSKQNDESHDSYDSVQYNYLRIQRIAFMTIFRKEINRILRIWTQTLIPPTITITLYFVIFGTFIGSRVGEVNGVDYMAFIIPGLIMMSVINNSYSNVVSSFFGAKFQRSVDELLVSSTSTLTVILGYVAGGMFRGLAVGFLVTLVSLFFSELKIFNIFILIISVLLTSFMFSLAGFINSMFAKRFDDVMIIPTFVLTPLIYLGGVFFSLSQLGPAWQFIAQFNPILYMINLFRFGFLGQSDINIYIALSMLVIASSVLFYYAYKLLDRGYGMRS